MRYNPVIRQEDNQLIFQNEIEDIVYMQSGEPYTFFNIKGCNVLEEQSALDYSLIQDIDTFVFETVEEYSVALTNLILRRFPNKRIFFLDEVSLSIWENQRVQYVTDESILAEKMQDKCMFIYSEIGNKQQTHVGKCALIYSSLLVMQSLCWARKRVSLGEKNPDKTILLIEFSGKNAGMGDIVISAQQYIRLAFQRGWYPVVNLTEDNQYISHIGDNMWDYYFMQPTEISIEEALGSKNVIRGSQNNFGVLPWHANPLCNMNDALKEQVYLNKNTLASFKANMPKEFLLSKKILAVIARGTDLAKCTHLQIDIQRVIDEVKESFACGYNYIFLATEDEEYLRIFQENFGDKVLFIDQKRITHDYEADEYKYVAELLDVKEDDRKEWGSKYLLITYCLSRCNALLYSIPCGALRLANIWKENSFDFIRCTFSAVSALEDKKEQNLIHIYECDSFLQHSPFTIIYGIGDVAQMIYPIVDKYRNKVIACDKRALYENYDFHGIMVIPPTELLKKSDNAKILIASPRCGKEIQAELIGMGIDREKIVQLDY